MSSLFVLIVLLSVSCVSALNIFPIEPISGRYTSTEKAALKSIFGENYRNNNYPCPFKSARVAPDQYVVKIVAEGTEMMMNAHRILSKVENLEPDEAEEIGEDWMNRMMKYARKWWKKNNRRELVKKQTRPNKIRNPNHPMSIWCRGNVAHFLWIVHYSLELSKEHLSRPMLSGNKPTPHMYIPFLEWSVDNPPEELSNKKVKWTDPPKCMPEECKVDCVIQSYRNWVQRKRRTYNIVTRGEIRILVPVISWCRDYDRRPDYITIVDRRNYIIN